MLSALEKHMPAGTRWTVPEGGMFIWVELPRGMSADTLFPLALDKLQQRTAGDNVSRMRFPLTGRWLALVGLLLGACVTSVPTVREADETPETVSASREEARADPSCLVPLCDEGRCALWRCQDVVEAEERPVLLAQALVPVRPPVRAPPSQVPVPSFRTSWEDHPGRWWGVPLGVPTGVEPIFEIPWHNWRERERQRFVHQWLHSGGPEGGQWNEAWRQFAREKGSLAKKEDIWRFAGELMLRFGVNGPLVPYHCD